MALKHTMTRDGGGSWVCLWEGGKPQQGRGTRSGTCAFFSVLMKVSHGQYYEVTRLWRVDLHFFSRSKTKRHLYRTKGHPTKHISTFGGRTLPRSRVHWSSVALDPLPAAPTVLFHRSGSLLDRRRCRF